MLAACREVCSVLGCLQRVGKLAACWKFAACWEFAAGGHTRCVSTVCAQDARCHAGDTCQRSAEFSAVPSSWSRAWVEGLPLLGYDLLGPGCAWTGRGVCDVMSRPTRGQFQTPTSLQGLLCYSTLLVCDLVPWGLGELEQESVFWEKFNICLGASHACCNAYARPPPLIHWLLVRTDTCARQRRDGREAEGLFITDSVLPRTQDQDDCLSSDPHKHLEGQR